MEESGSETGKGKQPMKFSLSYKLTLWAAPPNAIGNSGAKVDGILAEFAHGGGGKESELFKQQPLSIVL